MAPEKLICFRIPHWALEVLGIFQGYLRPAQRQEAASAHASVNAFFYHAISYHAVSRSTHHCHWEYILIIGHLGSILLAVAVHKGLTLQVPGTAGQPE